MPNPNLDPVQVAGQPVLQMGNVPSLPSGEFPDPLDMHPLEVGHSTALTVNGNRIAWRVWLRFPLADGEVVNIEVHQKLPGGDWTISDTEVFTSVAVLPVHDGTRPPSQPYYGFAIDSQELPSGTQFRLNCTRVDSANWLYLATGGSA